LPRILWIWPSEYNPQNSGQICYKKFCPIIFATSKNSLKTLEHCSEFCHIWKWTQNPTYELQLRIKFCCIIFWESEKTPKMSVKIEPKPTILNCIIWKNRIALFFGNLKKLPKCLWKWTKNTPYCAASYEGTGLRYFLGIRKNSQKVCENSFKWVRCLKIPLLLL